MKKTILAFTLAAGFFAFTACNSGEKKEDSNATETEQMTDEDQEESTPEEETQPEESTLGGYETILGNWTVDAETAGLRMDLTFEKDGTFKQKMGTQDAAGTWEVVDADHIKIVTPNVKNGQTWLIKKMTDSNLDICWNPDSDDPKTIPFLRP